MHLSILILLLTKVLSTLALPAASNDTSTLSIATYSRNGCQGTRSLHENITYNHIFNGVFSSHALNRDLESTEQLIFGTTYYGNVTVQSISTMRGCNNWKFYILAENFVLRSRAGALSSPDLQKTNGAGDGLRRTPELGIILLLVAGFWGYYVLAVAE